MRIAVVTSYFPIAAQPNRGQSAYQTLRKMRSSIEIQAFCALATYPAFSPRTFRFVRPDLSYSPPDIPAQYIEYPAIPLLSRPINGLVCAERVLPHLRRFQPDLILSYYVYPDGYAALSAGRRLGIPVILGAIGSDLNRIPDRISKALTQKALRQADFVLTVSEHLRSQAIRLGAPPERTRAIRNGCDSSIFHLSSRTRARAELGLDPESQIVVFVGWLASTKGLRELIDAVERLAPTLPRLQLVCIGDGDLRPELETRIARAGLTGQVRFTGQRSSEEVARWFAASDVFCLPSYAEGCPNAVIEALACGRPVVATQVGGIPELVDSDSGILIPPRDSGALADALKAALARTWDEAGIARRCQRSWDQVAEETTQICMECLENSTTRR